MHTENLCDLDVCPMTSKFNKVLEVVEVHVRAKFHQAKCSGSRVIMRREKQEKNSDEKQYRPSLPRTISYNTV